MIRRAIASACLASGVCAAVALLAACNGAGSQVAPPSAMQAAFTGSKPAQLYATKGSVSSSGLNAEPGRFRGKIIYTRTKVVCGGGPIHSSCTVPIDLNNDGVTDFTLSQYYNLTCGGIGQCTLYGGATVTPITGNGVIDRTKSGWAAALNPGAQIGSNQRFDGRGSILWNGAEQHSLGNWMNAGVHYLGLVFQINGRPHYGWARLSVVGGMVGITTMMTGYAYEARAGKSLRAAER